MIFVHAVKVLHTHPASNASHHYKHTGIISETGNLHGACTICEFQLAKDAPHVGEILLVIAPVHVSAIYGRLLTSINSDCLFIAEGRGPPQA
jgi:hypothetical protein